MKDMVRSSDSNTNFFNTVAGVLQGFGWVGLGFMTYQPL